MSILKQKTIKGPISFSGIGLHSGKNVKMTIKPSSPNSGIIFKRTDLQNNNLIIPNVFNVVSANLCTTISNEFGAKVSTIEHLMSAMYVLGVDNAIVELNSEEVPIMDGSAKNFVEEITNMGFVVSDVPLKLIKIEKTVSLKKENKFIAIEKSNISLDIEFEIKYNNPLIGTQKNKISVYQDNLDEVLSSRTFCLFEDIEKLKKAGLAQGGSLDNAIVVKDDKVLNKDGLRNKLEFVNHKILDCIGDIYLSGYKLIGSIKCSQGGHKLTNSLLREVFKDKSNFSIFELKEKSLPHTFINKSALKSIA
jgi:UDP-3-O-[3-hydroxymyristoyl] N-acetylglucosamine deacetylase